MYNNYQLRTELYSFDFDYGCMMMDGSYLWEPQKCHDFLVPLHHCSIDIVGNRMDLERLIDWATDEIPRSIHSIQTMANRLKLGLRSITERVSYLSHRSFSHTLLGLGINLSRVMISSIEMCG